MTAQCFHKTQITQRFVNNMWCCENCCNENLMLASWLHESESSPGLDHLLNLNYRPLFHIVSSFSFLCVCSGHCYYQTIVTPVSLPDSPCSRIPHTVTLVSIPASAEGNNGRRGRGFSVAIDQPLSPTNGFSPEHGRTVRVSQWVSLSMFLCVFAYFQVIVWRGETRSVWWRTKDKDEIKNGGRCDRWDSFKMYNREEGQGNEQKSESLLFKWAESLSDLRFVFQRVQEGLWTCFLCLLFSCIQGGRRLHQSRCEKLHSCGRQDPWDQRDAHPQCPCGLGIIHHTVPDTLLLKYLTSL